MAVVIIVILAILYSKSLKKKTVAESNLIAITDTLKTYKDAYGRQVAKIAVLESDKLNNFLKIKTKDSTVIRLQEVIKENPTATTAIAIDNNTSINTKAPTKSDGLINPTYTSDFDLGGWVIGTSTATKDSTHLDLKIYNKYDVVIKKEDGQMQAYVTNHNPYTSTTMQRAATLTQPRIKRFGIGPSVGVTYNQGFKPTYGITLQYNLIRF